MGLAEKLAQERRLRLAAERLLEQKSRELYAANQQLDIHARALSEQIVEQRQVVASALSEAEALKGQNIRVLSDLEKAHTAAVMAERRLWDSVDTILDGFSVFDSDGRLVAANRAYMRDFSDFPEVAPGVTYRRIMEIAVQSGLVVLDPDEGPQDWVAAIMARHEAEVIDPREIRLSDGRWIKLIDRRARDGDMVSLTLDITESKLHEEELRDARNRAEAASRAKSTFLANMSHEIRTPMNGVVGMAELLCDTTLSEEQRLYAETIRSSGEALLAIINDILDYSKIEAQRLVLQTESFDLERCIHDVATLLMPGARRKNLDLIVDFDVFLPTRYYGDAGRIRQILTNLVGNAVKFTTAGHVLIRVVGFEVEGDSRQLHVSVEDTGIGIEEANLDHIFAEFSQVEDQANRKFEGTGLGLAITRRLVELMGGEVWVDSTPGQGSAFGFAITLPVAEGDSDSTRADAPIRLRHALVVDDHPVNRTILERQLVPFGIAVQCCRNGADALAAAVVAARSGEPFDLVISDQDMPGMSGTELALALREAGLKAPVMVLSSAPLDAAVAVGPDEAIAAVLQKPLLRRDLIRRLQDLSSPAPTEAPAIVTPEAVTPPPAAAPRRMRVLAAEDNRTNQLVFAKMIKDLDIELTFAGDGREAVELFRRLRPDIIFMDISMPEMDGRQATAEIRRIEAGRGDGSRVPVVALTAHAMPGDSDSILAAGLDRYLTKPLRKAAIVEAITDFCPVGVRPPTPEARRTPAPETIRAATAAE